MFQEILSYGVDIGCFIENQASLGNKPESFMGVPICSLDEAVAKGYLDIAVGSWEYKDIVIDHIHNAVDVNQHRLRLYSV